jgi:subtilisin family serine protease
VPGNREPFEPLEQRLVYAAIIADDGGGVEPATAEVTLLAEEWSAAAWASDTSAARDRFGLYGYGQTVAIIDSGIAYDHPALGGGLGTDYRVVGGWDFAENDANPYDDGPLGFHGTHVAGIVGSSDNTYTGVAPGADLVALRVFDDQGAGETEWIASALWWVHEHRMDFEYPITTVNLSLGLDDVDTQLAASIESALQTLERDGIFIAVSAGNDFDGSTQLKDPANSAYVVPVASVGDDGLLSDFTQRNSRILAAPGEMITSTVPDYLYSFDGVTDDFAAASGTSMAAPHLAGASVLLREVFENLGTLPTTQTALYHHLLQTADTIEDVETQLSYRRVNLSAALEAAVGPDEAGADASSAADLGRLSHELSLEGVIQERSDVDTFTFVAAATGTLQLDATWSAPSDAPTVTLDGAVEVGTSQYRVSAGQQYTLSFEAGLSVGRYEAILRLEQTNTMPIAAAPTSRENETNYVWTAEQAGWYEFQIELDEPSASEHVRIYAANDELIYASSQIFTAHTAQLFVETGAQIRIALSGCSPHATFSAVNLNLISSGNGGSGGSQSAELEPGGFEGLAAVIFTSPDQVHQLAWATQREIAIEDLGPTLVADSAMAETIEQPWLKAIVASTPTGTPRGTACRSSAAGDEHENGAVPHTELADELFASPDPTVTSNLLRD